MTFEKVGRGPLPILGNQDLKSPIIPISNVHRSHITPSQTSSPQIIAIGPKITESFSEFSSFSDSICFGGKVRNGSVKMNVKNENTHMRIINVQNSILVGKHSK